MAVLLLVAQSQIVSAKNAELVLPAADESNFLLDEEALSNAMLELNELDNYLNKNTDFTYSDLGTANFDFFNNLSPSSAPMGMAQEGEAPLGLPAFLWGCVLGWVGILLVYVVTDNDKAQVKKALTGCLISSAVTLGIYVVYIIWLIEESNYYY